MKAGDRVQVCYDAFSGKRGTVLAVSPVSGTLIVKLDKCRWPRLSFGPNEVVQIDGR